MHGVTNEEIAAVVEGSADRTTESRVIAAALLDAGIRERLQRLRRVEVSPQVIAEDDGSFPLRAQRLKERMETGARQIARERRESYDTASTPARAGPAAWAERVGRVLRLIVPEQQALTLPCLAPASASSVAEPRIRRDLFLCEGVRVELQQLPTNTEAPAKLRVFVDAAGVAGGFETLQADTAALELAGLGALSVPLNTEGRGFVDFVIGGRDEGALTPPRRAVTLTGIALVRRSA